MDSEDLELEVYLAEKAHSVGPMVYIRRLDWKAQVDPAAQGAMVAAADIRSGVDSVGAVEVGSVVD